MLDLFIHPNRFFLRKSNLPAELVAPAVIVFSVSAFGCGIAYLVAKGLKGGIPADLQSMWDRLTIVNSLLAASINFLAWPMMAIIITGTGIVLWDRQFEISKICEILAYSEVPILFGAMSTFFLLIFFPPSPPPFMFFPEGKQVFYEYMRKETIVGNLTYARSALEIWSGFLLTIGIRHSLRLTVLKAATTILLPYFVYKGLLIIIQRLV